MEDTLLNPNGSIWQFFTVQDMMLRGELDGDPADPETVAAYLSDPDGELLTVDEVVELGRQAQEYDARYRR
jgi:hypothetical protein